MTFPPVRLVVFARLPILVNHFKPDFVNKYAVRASFRGDAGIADYLRPLGGFRAADADRFMGGRQ